MSVPMACAPWYQPVDVVVLERGDVAGPLRWGRRVVVDGVGQRLALAAFQRGQAGVGGDAVQLRAHTPVRLGVSQEVVAALVKASCEHAHIHRAYAAPRQAAATLA